MLNTAGVRGRNSSGFWVVSVMVCSFASMMDISVTDIIQRERGFVKPVKTKGRRRRPFSRVPLTFVSADRPDVSLRRALDRGLGVAGENRLPPTAIDPVKDKRLDGRDDVIHGRRIQRNHVGVAVHEADPAPV